MKPLPENVELMRDVSAARWVVEGLRPWSRFRQGVPVAGVVPEGFEAYARVRHEGQAQTEYGDDLPPEQLTALAGLLSGFTSTPDPCWICIWSGYGFWRSRAHMVLVFGAEGEEGRAEARRLEAEFQRVMDERDRLLDGVPEVDTDGREYYLFRGPLSEVDSVVFDHDGAAQSPNLWWPDDRAWCVGSDIDLPSTYVGGSRACIDAVIATPELDASEVGPDDSVSQPPTAAK
jgi:hypothetical protein